MVDSVETEGRRHGQAEEASADVDIAAACRVVEESAEPETALRALAPSLGGRVFDVALALATHDDVEVRRVAVEYLGTTDSVRAVACLVELLGDSDAEVRMHARGALAEGGGQAAVDALLDRLRAGAWEQGPVAIDILGTILERQGPLYVTSHRVRVPEVVAALGRCLDHPEAAIRLEAARALAKGGKMSAPAMAVLAERLTDPVYAVRANAVAALASMGSQEVRLLLEEIALPALRDDLRAPDPVQRATAANALRHVGGAAVPVLIDALATADDPLRFAIMLSLRRLEAAGHGVVRALLSHFNDDDARMRRNILYTLQDIATPEALEVVRMARVDVVEDPLDRVLRFMETWARRDRVERIGPYRMSYGELVAPEPEASVGEGGRATLHALPARAFVPIEQAFRQRMDEVQVHFGDRLSEHPCWEVVFERGDQLEGLLFHPVPMQGLHPDSSRPKPMEVVFQRAGGQMVLVIGGD